MSEPTAGEQTCLEANCDPCTPQCLALHVRLTSATPDAGNHDQAEGVGSTVASTDAPSAAPDAGDASEPLSEEVEKAARLTNGEWHRIWTAAGNGVSRLGDAARVIDQIIVEREAAAATRARAEALREAAEDMVWDFVDHPVTRTAVREWLHAQANAVDTPARTKPTTASLLADLAATREADQGAREKRALGGAS